MGATNRQPGQGDCSADATHNNAVLSLQVKTLSISTVNVVCMCHGENVCNILFGNYKFMANSNLTCYRSLQV